MIAFTVVSRAQLSHARVLSRSFQQHHPSDEFWALVIDDIEGIVSNHGEPFRILDLADLDIDRIEVHRMAMLFGTRLAVTIKPWVFEHFHQLSDTPVVYLDSDVMVYDHLGPLREATMEGVALVPHALQPLPRDGKDPDETKVLGVGLYDAGLLGAGRGASDFIQFLKERLRRECIFDPSLMRANEQRWLDFVPSLFPYRVVRDPGIDVAYWNLHERPLSQHGQTLLAGGAPLRCVHFSTFDPRLREIAGRYEASGRPRVTRAADPVLSRLCQEYGHRLLEEGFEEVHRMPFGFNVLPDGTPVYASLRSIYADSLIEAETSGRPAPPDPFDATTVGPFRDWAAEAYRRADLPVPRRLQETAARAENLQAGSVNASETAEIEGSVRKRIRRLRSRAGAARPRSDRKMVGRPSPKARPPSPPAQVSDHSEKSVVDWLGSLEPGSAGTRLQPTGRQIGLIRQRAKPAIGVAPTDTGVICLGPGAIMDPGRYQATVEFFLLRPPNGASPLDQALVAEVFLDGYVLGYTTASFDDVTGGPVRVDFAIPTHLASAALLGGVELRLVSRGMVGGVLGAVLVERTGTPAEESRQPAAPSGSRSWRPASPDDAPAPK